jgi:fimbrial chaperone protein
MRSLAFAVAMTATLGCASTASAASLRVAPVVIDLTAPTASSHITLWNDAAKPINVQVRIFKWNQATGADVLVPAQEVVASPPITSMKAGGQSLVRIVRTSKAPVSGEESYRLVVDELPTAGSQAATVVMVVRHSIPVFFSQDQVSAPSVEWNIAPSVGGYQVTAVNRGQRRFKVANLSLKTGTATLGKREGLVGYVLGGSSVSWFVAGKKTAGAVTVSGEHEGGSFNAKAKPRGG